jgi:hypothetical protein
MDEDVLVKRLRVVGVDEVVVDDGNGTRGEEKGNEG